MPGYQGHKNRNHWNVALWINNDEPTYRMAQSAVRRMPNKDEAARELLGDLPSHTPDGNPYSFSSIRAALRGLEA